ncbi:N-6 DNA methylase [Ferruginibacter sp. SUN106]|uniref:N-6 DNA methylase n=1 Tax=Ferruginibacter sp. SUN106 TaxID=2978348 RepID=UPI003D3640E9
MDSLGRYYTSNIISNLLVNNLTTKSPKKILDLGIGNASLSIAAYAKWDKAEFFATEIEKKKVASINKKLSFLKVYNYDTLNPNASEKLKIKFGTIDIAICNPPYVKVEDKNKYAGLFKSVGCKNFLALKRITSEIVFFAHNLKLLKNNGELGIIVSDSLITGKDYKIFRETIFEKFTVRRVIQLPDNIFNKTEARTHIIFISKTKSISHRCQLFMSSVKGKLSKPINTTKEKLVDRMDYQFHLAAFKASSKLKTLNDIGVIIKRGKFSYKELREKKHQFFHSIHFKENSLKIDFKKPILKKHIDYSAHSGDILMCRVGKRVVGKVAIIKGSILISDCIYRIKVPKKYQQTVLNSFLSAKGKKWLKAYAHGVCSQVISKSDLEKFPLFSKI